RREEERWLAADDDELTLLTGLLGRLEAALKQPVAPGQGEDSAETTEALQSLHAECLELLEKLEMLAARDEDEEAGVERRCVVHAVVRPQPKVDHAPPPKPSPAAPRVQRRRPDPAPLDLDGVKFGVVKSWDHRAWTGVIMCGGE